MGQIDWLKVYEANLRLISVKYRTLQYKILTKIVATKRLLYQMGITVSYRCDRCTQCIDTIMHRFWFCPLVRAFWNDVETYLRNVGLVQNMSFLNLKMIILGNDEMLVVNHIIIVGKTMIAGKYSLSVDILLTILKRDMITEKHIALERGKLCDHEKKWAGLAEAFDRSN